MESLAADFQAYAERADVSPVGTWRGNKTKKEQALNKRERFQLKGGDDLPQEKAPAIAGRGILLEGSVKGGAPEGVIVAQGGDAQGFALVLDEQKLHFLTCVDGTVTSFAIAHPEGDPDFRFTAEMSPAGDVSLSISGKRGSSSGSGKVTPVGEMPIDGLQVGRDSGGTVGEYDSDFAQGGEIGLTLTLLPKKNKKQADKIASSAASASPAARLKQEGKPQAKQAAPKRQERWRP